MLIVKNSVENVDELLLTYEKDQGLEFPCQLKKFLIKYNGGSTPNTTIKTKLLSTDVKCLYGFTSMKDSYNNIKCIEKSGIRLLPFGRDSFGNEFAIEIGEDDKIYFIDHEKENKVIMIFETFKEFISSSVSKMISEASRRTPEERERLLIEKGKGSNITEGLRQMWKEEYDKFINMVQEEVEI